MKIAFVGYRKQERYSVGSPKDEDQVLLSLFAEKSFDVTPVIWNDATVKWEDYGYIVLKSPWDYHEYFPEFISWLDLVEDLGIPLLNPAATVRWNIDKHYLEDIKRTGLPVIDFAFFEKDKRPVLRDYFKNFGTEKLIVKPCVSASAKNTMVVSRANIEERQEQLEVFLRHESFIVQPFVEEIVNGEISLVFLGGEYSHSVIKLPKAGDFRVQHFHGGTVKQYQPEQRLIAVAQQYVDSYARKSLYARVDGVLINNNFQLMELELIEPYLFLDTSAGAYEKYYRALVNLTRT